MAGRLSFRQFKDTVGAKIDTETTMNADHGFVYLTVPVNSPNDARLGATPAPGAPFPGKNYSLFIIADECIHRAGSDARRILADPAGDHNKSVFNSAAGPDSDTRLGQTVATGSPGAGEHAALTTDTSFSVNYR
jgi:hypothetical protein